jgi:hypothetical protein
VVNWDEVKDVGEVLEVICLQSPAALFSPVGDDIIFTAQQPIIA